VPLSDVIERPGFGAKWYDVARQPASTVNTSGIVVPGVPTTVRIRASIQPATGRFLRPLSEGQRAEENRVGFTRTGPVYTRQSSPSLEPDRFTIAGEAWIVFKVEEYDFLNAPYTRFWIARRVVP
jgi:hypothetical protein